jgi:hypothetical protein
VVLPAQREQRADADRLGTSSCNSSIAPPKASSANSTDSLTVRELR